MNGDPTMQVEIPDHLLPLARELARRQLARAHHAASQVSEDHPKAAERQAALIDARQLLVSLALAKAA